MNNSARWKEFIEWWKEVEPQGHLYPSEILVGMIARKIQQIKENSHN